MTSRYQHGFSLRTYFQGLRVERQVSSYQRSLGSIEQEELFVGGAQRHQTLFVHRHDDDFRGVRHCGGPIDRSNSTLRVELTESTFGREDVERCLSAIEARFGAGCGARETDGRGLFGGVVKKHDLSSVEEDNKLQRATDRQYLAGRAPYGSHTSLIPDFEPYLVFDYEIHFVLPDSLWGARTARTSDRLMRSILYDDLTFRDEENCFLVDRQEPSLLG